MGAKMRYTKLALGATALMFLVSCGVAGGRRAEEYYAYNEEIYVGVANIFRSRSDKTVDFGVDSSDLTSMRAGIWVDPNGCDHWIIDDGVEGYLSARLAPDGRPVCSGIAQPTETVGDFKGGATAIIGDNQ